MVSILDALWHTTASGQFSTEESWFLIKKSWCPIETWWLYNKTAFPMPGEHFTVSFDLAVDAGREPLHLWAISLHSYSNLTPFVLQFCSDFDHFFSWIARTRARDDDAPLSDANFASLVRFSIDCFTSVLRLICHYFANFCNRFGSILHAVQDDGSQRCACDIRSITYREARTVCLVVSLPAVWVHHLHWKWWILRWQWWILHLIDEICI